MEKFFKFLHKNKCQYWSKVKKILNISREAGLAQSYLWKLAPKFGAKFGAF